MAKQPNDSPALALLDQVWRNVCGQSWRVINESMQIALGLAIGSLMEFGEDDFAEISKRYRPEYWMSIEQCYARACGGTRCYPGGEHGPNSSAIKAIEKKLGRKPFIVAETSADRRRVRLCEGASFEWHSNMKERIRVTVTSFVAADPDKDTPAYVVACAYQDNTRSKVSRIFKITHEDLKQYHKAIADHKKSTANKTESSQPMKAGT